MDTKIIIGVDIGGTKIMTGAITPDGTPVGTPYKIPTGGSDSKEAVVARIFESIDTIIKQNNLNEKNTIGIGIGCTGPIDAKNGLILECPQLPNLHYFPLKQTIEGNYKIPVVLNNDANALILGESVWGAAKGFNPVLGFTLGTGLGCATVLNGKLLMGSTESAGEIWTSPYKNGIIEDTVSGAGLSKIFERMNGVNISGGEIAELARQGRHEAIVAFDEFGQALGYAAAWCVNLIDPEVIVIGGSISNSWELFIPAMEKALKSFICPAPAAKLKIVKAALGDMAGFAGAASLVVCNSN